ncbi:MAG: PQQ-binding-like beta-propeller repeat protein [Fimbriimonadaceae bacterium]|nr:PQQ-binding-like beta-propeller repeat protein [Fimbriimonadaceae bacterium]
MHIKRTLALGTALAMLTGIAAAQFDGPAPVAWRWTQPTPAAPLGAPLVVDDTVYVAVGQRIYALDKATGNQKWRYPAGLPIEGYFRSGVLKAGDTIVAAADNKTVFAVDAATGNAKWQYILPVPVIGEPVLVENAVVVALSDNSLMAINAADGQPLWPGPYKVFDGLNRNLGAHNGNVLLFTATSELRAIDVTTQKTVWRARFTQIGPDAFPVVYGDNVYVISGPFVAAVNAVTGGGRGQIDTREQLGRAPAVSAEGVFVVTREGKALGFDLDLRRQLFNPVELGSLPAVRPSAVGTMFLAPTTNGALNLINPKNGQTVWSYLVRPTITSSNAPATGGQGADPGGGGVGGVAGGKGGGQQKTQPTSTEVLAVAATGPAVLGGSTLFVLVEDGSLLAFDRKTGVDLTSPDVEMLWPNMGDLVSGQPPLELIFKIQDEASGIDNKSLKIDVDGTELEHEFGRDGIAISRISSLGKNKPLSNGRKKITVTVSDWMGNETRKSYSLVVDNSLPPLVRPTGDQDTTGGGAAGRGKGGAIGGVGGGTRGGGGGG